MKLFYFAVLFVPFSFVSCGLRKKINTILSHVSYIKDNAGKENKTLSGSLYLFNSFKEFINIAKQVHMLINSMAKLRV